MSGRRRWTGVGLTLAVLLVATSVLAGERLSTVGEPADEDVTARKSAQNSDESEVSAPTQEEMQEAREAAAREMVMLEANAPEALHKAALTEGGPPGPPVVIAGAIDAATQDVLQRSGRVLITSHSDQRGSTRLESVIYSDGYSILQLIWQDWPARVELQSVLAQGTRVEQVGKLDITIREMPEDDMIEVGVFDGTVYARSYATFAPDVTLQEMRTLALGLYGAITDSG